MRETLTARERGATRGRTASAARLRIFVAEALLVPTGS